MEQITILGSTGSIGQKAVAVIRHFPKRFKVRGLSTNANIDILYQQIKEFHPALVYVKNIQAALALKPKLKNTKLFFGEDGLREVAGDKSTDRIILAISGASALLPLLAAIENKKTIALANKEALVMAGPIIMQKAKINQVKIIPIDSEQSAIWQCLNGEDKNKLKTIYLTASGGPFRQIQKKDLKGVSVRKVIKHPKWKMGKKISVDSANLMNKGLEVLEAMYLFDVKPHKIKILIHPEAIIHSMVEFIDGVILAQLSVTDMYIPIQYALSYPERLGTKLSGIDFYKLKKLQFQEPDFKQYPCLTLAYQAANAKGTMPAVLNAANEVSVDAFLKRRLDFISIPNVIEKVMCQHRHQKKPNLDEILAADAWARKEASGVIDKL
jgi:1-deoxy-D-xylulose-5-phosphate reductoisomerase